jgi:hypothetical protein
MLSYNLDMGGILDSKSRVLDTIITLDGKRQLSLGGLNIKYVTFTDATVFYQLDAISGSADATLRTYLENCHLPQDQITFKSNDGNLISTFAINDITIKHGQVFQQNFSQSLSSNSITGSALHNISDNLLLSSIDNYVKQMPIGTIDLLNDEGFAIGNDNIEFDITNDLPIKRSEQFATISSLEDLQFDPRLSHLINFKFLPPVNKINEQIDKSDYSSFSRFLLGNYEAYGTVKLNSINHITFQNELIQKYGNKYVKTVKFDPTSRTNSIFMQIFEISNENIVKLDVIDYGIWHTPMTYSEVSGYNTISPICQIFFVGKSLLKPDTGTYTFIHMFTLVFEQ